MKKQKNKSKEEETILEPEINGIYNDFLIVSNPNSKKNQIMKHQME